MWVALILSLLLWVKRVFPYWADSSGDLCLDFILLGWVHTAFPRLRLLRRSTTYKLHVRSASFKRELELIQRLFFICCKFSIIIIWRLTLYLNSICNRIRKAWLKSRVNLRILNSKGKISLMTSLFCLMWYLYKSLSLLLSLVDVPMWIFHKTYVFAVTTTWEAGHVRLCLAVFTLQNHSSFQGHLFNCVGAWELLAYNWGIYWWTSTACLSWGHSTWIIRCFLRDRIVDRWLVRNLLKDTSDWAFTCVIWLFLCLLNLPCRWRTLWLRVLSPRVWILWYESLLNLRLLNLRLRRLLHLHLRLVRCSLPCLLLTSLLLHHQQLLVLQTLPDLRVFNRRSLSRLVLLHRWKRLLWSK